MQVIVTTSDHSSHYLNGFFHLWHKYFHADYNYKFLVCGYANPGFPVDFYSIGEQADYPVSRWSDAFIKILDNVADDVFLLLFEDYWLTREVDARAIKMCYDYVVQFGYVVKIDLTTDRLFADGG